MKTTALILVFLSLSLSSVMAQSETVQRVQDMDGSMTGYIYPSVIRMLTQSSDPDFARFIKDLKHLEVTLVGFDLESASSALTPIESELEEEGYEEYMSVTKGELSYRFFNKKSDDEDELSFVISLIASGKPMLIEMVGSVDMEYLSALSSMDLSKINDLLKGDMNWNFN